MSSTGFGTTHCRIRTKQALGVAFLGAGELRACETSPGCAVLGGILEGVDAVYRFTDYFEKEVLRKRPYLKKEWCTRVLENPIRWDRQEGNRYRFKQKSRIRGTLFESRDARRLPASVVIIPA